MAFQELDAAEKIQLSASYILRTILIVAIISAGIKKN